MAAAYNVTIDPNDPNRIIIISTDDGNEMNTTYSENQGTGATGTSPTPETTTEGAGNTITWSTPVQDGTRGVIGGRGPGVFNRAVTMTRPSTFLSSSITAGEVTEIFGDFSSFLSASSSNPRTVQIGANPIQVFTYTGKGAGDLSLTGNAQTLLAQTNGSTVTGYFDAPEIGDTSSAELTIGGQDVTLTYNQVALQTVCNDQGGTYQTAGASSTLAIAVEFGNTFSITVADGSNFNFGGTAILANGSFEFTSRSGNVLSNTEAQSVLGNVAGSTVTQAANSCSASSGVPIGGDTAVITYLEAAELPGNTATRSALHDGSGTSDDDWTEFELVIDGDLLVQGTVVAEALIVDGATLVPSPNGSGELTVGQINADNINANQITTAKLAAGAATFDKIDLNGQLRVSTEGAGAISWGKNDAQDLNSVGMYLGNANATNTDPRFLLGNPSSYIFFDGNELFIVGATNTNPNLEAQFYSSPNTFFYAIAPTHSLLVLELSGAGGGGGSNSGAAGSNGEDTVMTVQKRTRNNGVDTYSTRFGELGGTAGGGLATATTVGSSVTEVFVTSNEGFLSEGFIDLTTTGITTDLTSATSGGENSINVTDASAFTRPSGSVFITGTNSETFNYTSISGNTISSTTDTVNSHSIGDNVIGTSAGRFNYTERRAIPQGTTTLAVAVDGRTTQVSTLVVVDVTGFPTSGTVVFGDGDEFNYNSVDSTTAGAHEFRSSGAQTIGAHAVSESITSATIDYSFRSGSSQDISTHGTSVATTIRGNDHVFTAVGGNGGSSGTFTNAAGDGEAGDVFDARVQTGDFGPAEGNFRGDGGTAGDFDGDKNGGIGGRGEGFGVNGETLDVSDGGGGGAASSVGANDGGEGGEDGTYLTVFGDGYGDGRYTIVSATDRIMVVVGNGGTGSTGGSNTGGVGGDGAAQITGI